MVCEEVSFNFIFTVQCYYFGSLPTYMRCVIEITVNILRYFSLANLTKSIEFDRISVFKKREKVWRFEILHLQTVPFCSPLSLLSLSLSVSLSLWPHPSTDLLRVEYTVEGSVVVGRGGPLRESVLFALCVGERRSIYDNGHHMFLK